jgi:hypothetical protein
MVGNNGVLAHRFKCTYYEKCILNVIQICQKQIEKYSCIHPDMLCSHTIFCGCVKNLKMIPRSYFGAPKIVLVTQLIQNIYFFGDALCADIEMSECTPRIVLQIF